MLTFFTAAALAGCTVTDGDTIRCGDERIRLIGIDAPEMGKCPPSRRCVAGNGPASRQSLAAAMRGQRLTIRRLGRDRYGRTLGVVYAGRLNLSCHQLAAGQAQYVARWDNRRATATDCPQLTR